MFLNAENTKLIEYLKLKNMYRYADAYFQFLDTGAKLDKSSMKILLKNIRSNDFAEFEKNILEIFSKFEITVTLQQEKNTLPKSSLIRVKKHRDNIKAKGYKNISLQLSPDIYQKLKSLKLKNNMTYSELIDFLISKEN
jgi:hypothetical protein